jgi:transposase
MQIIKTWILNSNGWQRLWLVVTITGYVYFCLLMPFLESEKSSSYRYQVLSSINSEMKKPECASYMNLPFDQLVEPSFQQTDEGCYYIYNHRHFSDTKQPITPKSVGDKFTSDHRQNLLEWFLIGLLFSTISAAVLYSLGALTAWVIKGFRKK